MEEKFKAFLKKPWIVRDDGVVFNKTFMPYEKRPIIACKAHPNGITLGIGNLMCEGNLQMLVWEEEDDRRAVEAIRFANKNSILKSRTFQDDGDDAFVEWVLDELLNVEPSNRDALFAFQKGNEEPLRSFYSSLQSVTEKLNSLDESEIKELLEVRMRCNVCGKVFCYTMEDIQKNQSHQNWAKAHAVASLFGTQLDMYGQQAQMNRELDKVIDFNRCPSCNSTDISLIADDKKEIDTKSIGISSADEIKKFKELLDIGAITQEEFDAKKKQLLGL